MTCIYNTTEQDYVYFELHNQVDEQGTLGWSLMAYGKGSSNYR